MMISTKAWTEYIRKMSAISEKAAAEMQRWIQKNGFGDDQALLEYAFALSSQYGEAIGALACDMYEKIAEAQGVTIPPAEMADTPEFAEVAKAVHGTMKESLNKVEATVGRLVKQTGADTMLKNAIRDGAYFAWVAHGDTCPYCLMLSAIGWQKAGKNTIRGKHADHIHPHCDCQYVVDFKGDLKVEGYDPDKMQQEIMDIVDPDEKEYAGFEDFIGRYGRQAWSRKGRDNTGLRILRRGLVPSGKQTGGKAYKPYDPEDPRDIKAAKAYRKFSREYDAESIANASGMTKEEIIEIKRHIFFEKHILYDGYDILYPDYDIAVAWKRLKEGKPEQRDLLLLKHELLEARVEREGNLTLSQAHAVAKKEFDWEKALVEGAGEEGEKDGIL